MASFKLFYDELAVRLRVIFERHGCSEEVARMLGENCAAAERDGIYSHGIFRMSGYVSTLKTRGWVDGHATPQVKDVAPSFLRIDAMNGFTVPALASGRTLAVRKAFDNGAAVIAIHNSHHLGALSLDVEPFAAEGLIALSVVNAVRSVAPFGGKKPVFGTNPIAFATPRENGLPLVFDLATSVMAKGEVQIAARDGKTLLPGVGVDRSGSPTTDPKSIVNGGALLTFGGYKGASLSLMVEILCAALGGGKFSAEVDLSESPGAATPHTGQTLILIDPNVGRESLPPFLMIFNRL